MFHKTQTKDFTSLVTEAQTQRGFIDEHISIADPSRTVDDDQDDEIPELTQTTSAEKRKVDEKAKELRALLPIITLSNANSTRLEHETYEQLTQCTIQSQNRKDESCSTSRCLFYVSSSKDCRHARMRTRKKEY